MTQKYYVEKILPSYIDAIQHGRIYGPSDGVSDWLLVEDGDPSHGMKSSDESLAKQLKRDNWVVNLQHPSKSPDLNCSEGIWNIIKNRVRRKVRSNHSDATVKRLLQEEWRRVSQASIRARIAEMPDRCAQLVKTGGKPIKSALW